MLMFKNILKKYFIITFSFGFLAGVIFRLSRSLLIVKHSGNFYGFPTGIRGFVWLEPKGISVELLIWGLIFAGSFVLLNHIFKGLSRYDIRDFFQCVENASFIPLKKLEGIYEEIVNRRTSFYLIKSSVPNALSFQNPFGESRIYLTSKLFEILNKSELRAVIWQMLLHIEHKHTSRLASLFSHLFFVQRISISAPWYIKNGPAFVFRRPELHEDKITLKSLMIYLLLSLFIIYLGLGLIGFTMFFIIPLLIVICNCIALKDVNSFSRQCKLDSDYYEVQKNRNAPHLIKAIEKIVEAKKELPPSFYARNYEPLFFISLRDNDSHPDVFERVSAIKRFFGKKQTTL